MKNIFIYGYMVSDIWLKTILIVRKETRCCHIGYSFRLAPRVLLYASSHRQDNTYHGLCYTSCGALAGTRNSSMGPLHERSNCRPIAPWVNTSYDGATSCSPKRKHQQNNCRSKTLNFFKNTNTNNNNNNLQEHLQLYFRSVMNNSKDILLERICYLHFALE